MKYRLTIQSLKCLSENKKSCEQIIQSNTNSIGNISNQLLFSEIKVMDVKTFYTLCGCIHSPHRGVSIQSWTLSLSSNLKSWKHFFDVPVIYSLYSQSQFEVILLHWALIRHFENSRCYKWIPLVWLSILRYKFTIWIRLNTRY